MAEKYAIQTDGLHKWYGSVHALRGVDIEVERGELFGFLGPNGAGKTTTIRCMLDLIRPQSGTIRVLGIDPQADPVGVRARVGYLPGELNMEGNLSVEGQLRYLIDLRRNNVEWQHVQRLAERLDLDLGMSIRNLSKGNKQKVGVVQALMHQPELLMMDEPTSGLDPLMQQEVYRLLREAQGKGTTVFFSSHILSEVDALADRVAIIRGGVIIEEADPRKLAGMERRRLRVRFREAVDANSLAQVDGVSVLSQDDETHLVLQVEGEMDSLIKALAVYPVSDIDIDRSTLEEVFLAYYETGKREAE